MNALQPSRSPLQPIPKRRVVPRPKRHLRQRSYKVLALETTAKIGVNVLISAVAISALVKLLPFHQSQQEKLREIRTEVKLMEERVSKLQAEFSRNFDPSQAKAIMQEQSHRLAPNQHPIVLIKQETAEIKQAESSN
ncbi:hypothetical protein ACF3DV_16055 [Chlorogloeopsis fritschii PCC 9212]|jgi:hypothetical protein|uniref:Cell division protein FtsL n=1 Tax=Chlorogloeopsis fritschii PCC 6912 TaxID=211165 RepID=A0A3S1AKV7_CHLFR|nr:hypothetical protein [Chlorogloeopsis fritschii]MBF2004274.1 hypothetical protein [Chlorogloeopsis fritschii C42_A2020_084]RUR83312.1 hypothetical protein PCC6912_21450 [Chlorogloeopsis fritschii PCC 6912]